MFFVSPRRPVLPARPGQNAVTKSEVGGRLRGMVDLAIQCFNLDTTDPARIASFWQEALGWRRTHDTRNEVALEPPAGSAQDGVAPDLLFLRVPLDKTVKNRWHLDLRPKDQAIEVARLEALGAVRVEIGQRDDVDWVVMADPDGNEFCVLRAFNADEQREIAEEAAAAGPS